MRKLIFLMILSGLINSLWASEVGETPVKIIPLAPPLNQDNAELSGLAWCDNKLVLMPQYPRNLGEQNESYFYYLEKKQILDYIDASNTAPLLAKKLLVNEKGLRDAASIFDGYEAIACHRNKIWLSIEAKTPAGEFQSFIVPGKISFNGQAKITIHEEKLQHIPSQSKMRNMGDEAIIIDGENLITLHEVNDPRVVAKPVANYFKPALNSFNLLSFPNLPYRITDATKLDGNKRFWAINYKYSGDEFNRDALDPLAEQYGQGPSHQKYFNVERLLEFQLNENGISMTDRAPLQIQMTDVEGRNWEGLVRLDNRGFLLATDKHPSTMLGYVALK